jgi:hypothetical protein
MASVELVPGEVPIRSNYPRYPDQKLVEDEARKTLSYSPGSGTNMSGHPMRKTATS